MRLRAWWLTFYVCKYVHVHSHNNNTQEKPDSRRSRRRERFPPRAELRAAMLEEIFAAEE